MRGTADAAQRPAELLGSVVEGGAASSSVSGPLIDDLAASTASLEGLVAEHRHAALDKSTLMPWKSSSSLGQGEQDAVASELHQALEVQEYLRVQALGDERAKLQRCLAVMHGCLLQQMEDPPTSNVARSVEVEMLFLRQAAEEELLRLQARAAAEAEKIVLRAKHRAAIVVESAQAQAAVTERSFRSALKVAQHEITEFESLCQSQHLKLKECESSWQDIEALERQLRVQQLQCALTQRDLHEVKKREEDAEDEVYAARSLCSEMRSQDHISSSQPVSHSGSEVMAAAELEEEERVLAANVAMCRQGCNDLEEAIAILSQGIRQERRMSLMLESSHQDQVGDAVREVEAASRQNSLELSEEAAEQRLLLSEEVDLLRDLRRKLHASLEVRLAEVADLEAKGALAEEQEHPKKHLATAISKVQAARSELDCINARATEQEEERCALQRGCDALKAVMANMTVPSSEPSASGNCPDWLTARAMRREHDVALAAAELRGELELSASLRELAEGQAEESARFAHNIMVTHSEQDEARSLVETLRRNEQRAATERSEKLCAVLGRLRSMSEDLDRRECQLRAHEARAALFRNEQRSISEAEQDGTLQHQALAAQGAAARARSAEMLRFSARALGDLEHGEAHVESLSEEISYLRRELDSVQQGESTAVQELSASERESADLEDELLAEAECIGEMKAEIAALRALDAERAPARAAGLELQEQIIDLREQLDYLTTGSRTASRASSIAPGSSLPTAILPRGAAKSPAASSKYRLAATSGRPQRSPNNAWLLPQAGDCRAGDRVRSLRQC